MDGSEETVRHIEMLEKVFNSSQSWKGPGYKEVQLSQVLLDAIKAELVGD